MIRIRNKPAQPPAILTTEGTAARDTHCTEYDSGKRDFPTREFSGRIYAHAEVKAALIEAQSGKCAFCECRVSTAGEVEHFRPKAAAQQKRGEPVLRPGYYWLAYDWDNLLLACSNCNGAKSYLFPLVDHTKRSRCHNDDVANEEPLLIHPVLNDPSKHLRFKKEIVVAIDAIGAETIRILRLNDPPLRDNRRHHFKMLMDLCDVLDNEKDYEKTPAVKRLLRKVRKKLRQVVREDSYDAIFCAMAQTALRARGRFAP